MNRRKFVKCASLAAFTTTQTFPKLAQSKNLRLPQGQAFFRFSLGDLEITVVSDGHFVLPLKEHAINASSEERKSILKLFYEFEDNIFRHTNHVIIDLKTGKRVLIDVGSGTRFMPTAGKLYENLRAAGIDPDTISDVILTHAHPDHIWGIRDDFDEVIFPKANYFIGTNEFNWWMQEDLVNSVSQGMQQLVLGAVNSLSAIKNFQLVNGEEQILPSISMIDLPGHTPGHMGVRVDSGKDSLIICGDALTNVFFDFEKPEWVNSYDMDSEKTVKSKKYVLNECGNSGAYLLGYHFPFPGVGRVSNMGDKYRFIPIVWKWS